jgi:hypothetical protein
LFSTTFPKGIGLTELIEVDRVGVFRVV